MSWSMPPAGQWNPGAAGMAMMPDMNMGAFTPEQWNTMQQQNWQQWAQWQQQYAQWQNQYGEKYAEQMQVMQTMGSMPPLPPSSAAPPPAPPPPDKPPPPPHENNQPLFRNSMNQPAPVPAPSPVSNRNNPGGYNNVNFPTGNTQNWSYTAETRSALDSTQPTANSQLSVNAEALRKLAEEERLFDIQFQKWEEEIDKWRRENVNHPDKQAYKEYEQKFEACRVQLLERRQQMKQKRDRLLNNAPLAPNSTNTGNNNTTTAVPPSLSNKNNHNQNMQQLSYQNKPPQVNLINSQYQQCNDNSNSGFVRSNNKNVDPQDRYVSYQDIDDYSAPHEPCIEKQNFLPTSGSGKGIPGLDLVPDADKSTTTSKQDVIDISEEYRPGQPQHGPGQSQHGPDYSTISKGINSILGDEKIMNILSMVRDQNAPPSASNRQIPPIPGNQYAANLNIHNMPPNNQWNRNDNIHHNQQNDRQNMPFNRQGSNRTEQHNPPAQNFYNESQGSQSDMTQEHYYDQYPGQSMPSRSGPLPLMRSNVPKPRPLLDIPTNHMANRGPNDNRDMNDQIPPISKPDNPKWVEEPLFTTAFIVEYEHKPLRLKARDFIEPVHLFEYNHTSKNEDNNKKDFEKEVDELFTRKPRHTGNDDDRLGSSRDNRYVRDHQSRDYERRMPKEDVREMYHPRLPPREDYEDRRRADARQDDRRRDERDRYTRREDNYRDREREKERDREPYRDSRDRHRDYRHDDRSRSRDRDGRKRARSKESELSDHSKKSKEDVKHSSNSNAPKHIVMIDDILETPGREMRPEKIVIILRGPPGSGKSYLAKLIRDREAEYGGTLRIMSIDDYFMQEGFTEEKDPTTGKIIKKPSLKYEYDEKSEESYLNSLKRAFKRSLTDGYFSFLIYDAVNDQLKSYADIWNFARQNGFQVYICTMELDAQKCFKRNIHGRKLEDIEVICSRFFHTPAHHIQLDATTLLQNAAIPDVQMEDAIDDVIMEDAQDLEVESVFTSKWEKMDDAAQLARLDGTSKPLRPSQLSMEDYLQLDDWKPNTAKPGKKTVRWADIEESRQQEKMRAIGFVVGQTDWDRMTDPTMGSSALTQTKYIERVRRH